MLSLQHTSALKKHNEVSTRRDNPPEPASQGPNGSKTWVVAGYRHPLAIATDKTQTRLGTPSELNQWTCMLGQQTVITSCAMLI